MLQQAPRDRGFLLALFQQGLVDSVPVADPAGDEVIELVRRHPLVRRPAANPQAQCVTLPEIPVEMHTVSADPEKWDGPAVEPKDGRRAPTRGGGEGLVSPFRDPAVPGAAAA